MERFKRAVSESLNWQHNITHLCKCEGENFPTNKITSNLLYLPPCNSAGLLKTIAMILLLAPVHLIYFSFDLLSTPILDKSFSLSIVHYLHFAFYPFYSPRFDVFLNYITRRMERIYKYPPPNSTNLTKTYPYFLFVTKV